MREIIGRFKGFFDIPGLSEFTCIQPAYRVSIPVNEKIGEHGTLFRIKCTPLLIGADHVCIGTDAPFDMADGNPKATIDAVPGITPLERQCVCCGTALKLLCEG
jgi:hypothetical protein